MLALTCVKRAARAGVVMLALLWCGWVQRVSPCWRCRFCCEEWALLVMLEWSCWVVCVCVCVAGASRLNLQKFLPKPELRAHSKGRLCSTAIKGRNVCLIQHTNSHCTLAWIRTRRVPMRTTHQPVRPVSKLNCTKLNSILQAPDTNFFFFPLSILLVKLSAIIGSLGCCVKPSWVTAPMRESPRESVFRAHTGHAKQNRTRCKMRKYSLYGLKLRSFFELLRSTGMHVQAVHSKLMKNTCVCGSEVQSSAYMLRCQGRS